MTIQDDLVAQINEQRQRLQELERALEAEQETQREAERLRPVEVCAVDTNAEYVNVKIKVSREDIELLLRRIPGIIHDTFANVWRLPITQWKDFKRNTSLLHAVKISHALGVEVKIKKFLDVPEFVIRRKERSLTIACHPEAIQYDLRCVSGIRIKSRHLLEIPLAEGWRLVDFFTSYKREGQEAIVWEGDALEFVQKDLEKRVRLDELILGGKSTLTGKDVGFSNGHTLRDFQLIAVEFVHVADGRALIADQMGLGKTWEAIAFANYAKCNSIFVVCPAHLKANWAREIISLTGEIPTILNGRVPGNHDLQELLIKKPRFVIINYDILGSKTVVPKDVKVDENGMRHEIAAHNRFFWIELINMAKPDLIILDEAHYIKNTDSNRSQGCRQLNSKYRLGLTGTPVLNRPGEYWAVLNWLNTELFPSEGNFLANFTYDNGKRARNIEQLQELLRPMMIRRLKKDIISELPPISRITQLHELSDTARLLYTKVLQGVYEKIDEAGERIEHKITSILAELGKLKEVVAHDTVQRTAELATELYDTEDDIEGSKLGHKKVLIFSQFKATTSKIASLLGPECLTWSGDTPMEQRTQLEERFQTDPDIKYLCVTLMTGQTGLNLTAAGHIIFNDLWWTPAAHEQAEERAYGRMSDMHGCDSFYIVGKDTIVEWIMELLYEKRDIIANTVDGVESSRDVNIGREIIRRLQEQREPQLRLMK